MGAIAEDSGMPTRAITRPTSRPVGHGRADISRVPYLPGLDGMRALAVVAVMVYHANPSWLPGGFLGVEVFFVISGYLITLLLIAEKERTYGVDMRQFWVRRARRLLPALFAMLLALTIWTALFERDALGKLRGDVIAALLYVANWYQIWTGAGYTASNDFAPLRHLWSLAVEEQFYFIWPVVMFALLRGGSRRIADVSRYLVVAAVAITVATAVLYHPGPVGTPEVTPEAYWTILGREISKLDALYLSTITRASGLLLGAAFAMVWRPVAMMRGPLGTKGRLLDAVALVGFVALAAMSWWMYLLDPDGANPWLFRGGFLMCAVATLMMVAAVTHQHALTPRLLSTPVLLWIGTRSYGLYLYHWPIYQLIRGIAGNRLLLHEFALAMVCTAVITEASYRFIETPIRKRTFVASLARIRRSPTPGPRNALFAVGALVAGLSVYAGVSLATAPVIENEVRQTLDEAAGATCDVINDPTCTGAVAAPVTPPVTNAPEPTTAPQGSVALPSTTVPPPPTTTLPPAPIPKLALGDSVMLGAAPQLKEQGFTVDATESRAFINGLDTVLTLQSQDRLGDVVVVHLGTNGTIGNDNMTRMMDALAGVPQVVLVTLDAPVAWVPPNNALIVETANAYPNVTLLDWSTLAPACPGECFYSDGFHLRPEGQAYYASLVAEALQPTD
jgi:peptidoglycan/LPS O-acetylase OafA/YrhL